MQQVLHVKRPTAQGKSPEWAVADMRPALVRAVMMHDLGQVLGLDHVDDPSQLMHAENNGLTDFADGKRRQVPVA